MGKKIIIKGADFLANGIVPSLRVLVETGQTLTVIQDTDQGGYDYDSSMQFGSPTIYSTVVGTGIMNEIDIEGLLSASVTGKVIGRQLFAKEPKNGSVNTNNLALKEVLIHDDRINNLHKMFYNDSSINRISISTAAEIVDTTRAFYGCTSLLELDLSAVNLSKVQAMAGMFGLLNNITSIIVGDINSAIFIQGLFQSCHNIQNINLSGLKSKNIINVATMFYECTSLTTLNLDNFDSSTITTYGSMFQYCNALTNISVQNCSSDTKIWLIERLATAGFTFTESIAGTLTKS